jgi:spore germination protein GerM
VSKERSLKIGLAIAWGSAVVVLVVIGLKLLNDFVLVPRGVSPLALPRASEEPKDREIEIYFADENASKLVPEKRQARLGGRDAEDARAIVAELIKGPQSDTLLSTIPGGTRLLNAYKVGDLLVLDFTHDLQTNHTGGSTGELLTVYSIVNTMTRNLEDIEKVQLLVEGEEMESLAGHLDLTKPLPPNLKWLAV